MQTEQLRPDLIIMNILISLLDGLTAAAHIMTYHPQIKILLFSTHTVRDFIEAAKELGLSGYVPKGENGPALRDAIDAVLHGRTYFPADAPGKASVHPLRSGFCFAPLPYAAAPYFSPWAYRRASIRATMACASTRNNTL